MHNVTASELISDTQSNNEPDLESETELEVVVSVNIEDGTECHLHAMPK